MKKICFITGTRAEYGLLSGLMRKVKDSKNLDLKIIATSMHLSKKYGHTYKEIINDGFSIDAKIRMLSNSDRPEDIALSTAEGIKKLSLSLKKIKPDIVVILGDRFEALSAALSSLFLNIPIIHIHGGEKTEGSIDESIRHAITKMSTWHFAATMDAYKRIIQLGEPKENVFYTGALFADRLKEIKYLTKDQIQNKLNFKFLKRNFIVTFHPETTTNDIQQKDFRKLLSVLSEQKETMIIFTMPNADSGNSKLNQLIKNFVKNNPLNSIYSISLGQQLYFSVLKFIDICIGNSSSGIIEVPYFKKPTINIGSRQKGREQASSIINCDATKHAINNAINLSYSKKFKKKLLSNNSYVYKSINTTKKMISIINKINLNKNNTSKKFNDLNFKF